MANSLAFVSCCGEPLNNSGYFGYRTRKRQAVRAILGEGFCYEILESVSLALLEILVEKRLNNWSQPWASQAQAVSSWSYLQGRLHPNCLERSG